MKKIIITLLLFTSLIASCSTSPSIVLKFSSRRYRPCHEEEIKRFRPEWKGQIMFCWRYCSKYKTWRSHVAKNCINWKTDILETQEDFFKLRAAGFILINEKRIY